MTIMHHPDDATLISYASGALSEALGAVVATHLAMCPTCRREVARMEAVGASLMQALEPVAVSGTALAALRALRASEADTPARRPDVEAPRADADVPPPISRLVGERLAVVRWKRLGYGVWHYPLPLSAGARGDLRLLKVAAGQAMPGHGHGGSELTLLLDGAYRDEIGEFRRGDLADLDDSTEHRPVADAVTGCVCLIASEKKARFTGMIGRLIQPFTGI